MNHQLEFYCFQWVIDTIIQNRINRTNVWAKLWWSHWEWSECWDSKGNNRDFEGFVLFCERSLDALDRQSAQWINPDVYKDKHECWRWAMFALEIRHWNHLIISEPYESSSFNIHRFKISVTTVWNYGIHINRCWVFFLWMNSLLLSPNQEIRSYRIIAKWDEMAQFIIG